MHVLFQIEKALKKLYRLDHPYSVKEFLANQQDHSLGKRAASRSLEGMVLFSNEWNDFQISIVLSTEIQKQLKHFKQWKRPWNVKQLNAFVVAVEELSHFHYLIYRATQKIRASLLELEVQGEVDRFVITYFSLENSSSRENLFEELFRRLFENFSFHPHLTSEQRKRYTEAHSLSSKFISSLRAQFIKRNRAELLSTLRKLYEKPNHEKIEAMRTASMAPRP